MPEKMRMGRLRLLGAEGSHDDHPGWRDLDEASRRDALPRRRAHKPRHRGGDHTGDRRGLDAGLHRGAAARLADLGTLAALPAPAPSSPPRRPTDADVAAAREFALGRQGDVSFAVASTRGFVRGHERTRTAPSASVFVNLHELLPDRHRAEAERLLAGVVPWQRWGLPAALPGRPVMFKGGWRRDIVHQAGVVLVGQRRVGIAVLTTGNPSQGYGRATVGGVARRLLGRMPRDDAG
jgi:hypothetical protein